MCVGEGPSLQAFEGLEFNAPVNASPPNSTAELAPSATQMSVAPPKKSSQSHLKQQIRGGIVAGRIRFYAYKNAVSVRLTAGHESGHCKRAHGEDSAGNAWPLWRTLASHRSVGSVELTLG